MRSNETTDRGRPGADSRSMDARALTVVLQLLDGGPHDPAMARAWRRDPALRAAVAAKARLHRVVPQLHEAVASGRVPGIGPDVTRDLERHARTLALNARFMTAELVRINRELAAHSIEAIAFKGPVLADMAYGSISAREFGDLDLLVHPADYTRAREVLAGRGLHRRDAPEHERRIGQTHLANATGRIQIDLHKRLAPRDFPGLQHRLKLWKHTVEHPLADGSVTTLTPPAALVVCCLQAMKDRWDLLYLLTDIRALVKRYGDECVVSGLELARIGHMRRIFLVGVQAAAELLGMPLPGEVGRAARSDPVVARLVREARGKLFGGEVDSGFLQPRHRLRLLMRDRAAGRIVYAARIAPRYTRLVFRPNENDRSWVILPHSLAFLYPLVRVARLLVARARRAGEPRNSV